jgi:hypothetical protein
LARFRYFRTAIAIHGDRRLMPRDKRHWSVFNVRCFLGRSLATVWKCQCRDKTPAILPVLPTRAAVSLGASQE